MGVGGGSGRGWGGGVEKGAGMSSGEGGRVKRQEQLNWGRGD